MKVYKDPRQLAKVLLQDFTKAKDQAVIRSLRRRLHHMRNLAVLEFRSQGVGRRIFGGAGKKASGARLIINRARVRKVGSVFQAGLVLRGLAALQERGGRTDPHVIKPKLAKKLIFPLGGRIVVTDQVNHPGSRVPAAPFAHRAMERGGLLVREDLDRELQRTADQVVG